MTLDDLLAMGFDKSRVDDDGNFRVRCSQCEALVISSVPCHETGCPNKRFDVINLDDEDDSEVEE